MSVIHHPRVYHMPPPLPVDGPRIEPAEAIAIGITMALARPIGPDHLVVRLVLEALSRSGWKIVPKGE